MVILKKILGVSEWVGTSSGSLYDIEKLLFSSLAKLSGDNVHILDWETAKTNAKIFAEGSDEEVSAISGTHSCKGWAEWIEAQRWELVKPADPNLTYVGAVSGVINTYDGSNLTNVKPLSKTIKFTSESTDTIIWNQDQSIVQIIHSLNCYPIVNVFDGNGKQVYPDLTIVNGNAISLNFSTDNILENETTPWTCSITYGSEYI